MSTLTVRISDDLEAAIAKFCQEENRSKSWLIKRAIEEKLEDWQDLRDGLKAIDEHRKNPKVISHKELMINLGLTDKYLE
jgi:predicted transcriptional regulator